MEYPEWKELTAAEKKLVDRYSDLIHDGLTVQSRVSVSRGQGMMDIGFYPFIRKGNRYFKLISAHISIVPRLKPTPKLLKTTRVAPKNSVLSTGKWVKISVTEDGIYQLTDAALRKMGFANPANVRLYGYGGHRLSEVMSADAYYDDLEEVPLYHNGSSHLFWANGLVFWEGNERIFNPYSTKAYYFLTEGTEPSTIATLPAEKRTPAQTYTTFTQHVLYEKDEFAYMSAGRNLYEAADFANSSVRNYSMSAPGLQGNARFTVAFSAACDAASKVVPSVNGTNLDAISLSSLASYTFANVVSRNYDVKSPGEKWTIKLSVPSVPSNYAGHLDYMAIHYTRPMTLVADDKGFVAFSQTGKSVSRFVVSEPCEVMRLGRPGEPVALVPVTRGSDGTSSIVVDDPSRRYVAFDKNFANFPSPTVEGPIANQDLHALDDVDMLIIIPASGKLESEAQRLADAHALYDGVRAVVVRADQIYNEFSSGTPDATAYRLFAKHLYDKAVARGEDGLRYLVLMGDCAFDNRMLSSAWRGSNPNDYLLCFESENSVSDTKSFVMEDYFGLLDDGEGASLVDDKSDLAIGRFPVTSAAEAKVMVDKTIDFLSNRYAGSWKNIISIMGDDGDNNSHLQYADDVAKRIQTYNPEMEVQKVMWDAYTRVSTLTSNTYPEVENIIRKQMSNGALVMNYTGHGATYCLSHEFVMKLADFEDFKGKRLPLWFTAACDIMPFDGRTKNIGETAVLNEGGAAVAFIGTARTVYASNNRNLNLFFMEYLLGTDEQGRRYAVGEALRLAKNRLIIGDPGSRYKPYETYNKENKLQYALLGDPALVFGAPTHRVVLDSVNGKAPSTDLQLRAGEKVSMAGHVEGADAAALPQFDGLLTARVYDCEQTVVCKNNAGADRPYEFQTRDKVLFVGQDSVRRGYFQLEFVVPNDISFSDESGRVVFYAVADSGRVEANGYSEQFTIGGAVQSADDKAPDIYVYLNRDDFPNGGVVSSTPYFVAQLHDESGINYSGGGVGHDLLLTVDNDPATTYILNDRYVGEFGDHTRGSVAFDLPALSAGKHTLKFRAWDVLNNTSTATLDFVVDEGMNYTAEVFDFTGKRLWMTTQTSMLADFSLPKLPKGVYIYRLTTHYSEGKDEKETKKIVVR
ncbi:MAG: type IX secretion system sortase PorU [Bacteroidaceae bacterium]|nr:type IX secretion system sortase PorU [Bacteroidaceae bacterium]